MKNNFENYENMYIKDIFEKFSNLHEWLCNSCQICKVKMEDIDCCPIFKKYLKESEKIKYVDSFLFTALYHLEREKVNLTEDIILENSIKFYKETIEKIIKSKCNSKILFKLNNIDTIVSEIFNPKNDLNKEINFIKSEFSELNEEEYILNNLSEELMNFSTQYKIVELIEGLSKIIEINNKINKNNSTNIFIIIKQLYNIIINNKIKEEEIHKIINFFKNEEYYTNNNQHFLKTFIHSIFEKKESLFFIKEITDLIVNRNETSNFNEHDIDDLINI